MSNLSLQKRQKLTLFLNQLREQHNDDESLIIINDLENELKNKKYGLVWEQYQERVDTELETQIPVFTECNEREIFSDENSGFNFLLEGDNLHSLYLLEKTHKERIDAIYIDPPYNTGNQDFVYDDKMVGKEDAFRHSKWISFMEKRLRIARGLLKPEGVIFISIDDNEYCALKMLCDEIFDDRNYQATITYVRKTSGKQDSSNFAKSTEYILVYSKTGLWQCNYLTAGERVTKRYNKVDAITNKAYREVDLRKTGTNDRREDRPNLYYPFYFNEKTQDLFCEAKPLEKVPEGYIEIYPIKADGTDGSWRWEVPTAQSQINLLTAHIMPKYKHLGKYTVYEKDFIDKKEEVRTVKEHTFWHRKEFNSDNAVTDFTSLGFNNKDFSFPKSVDLIKHILQLATHENALILDFFAGSGTTGQAAIELNKIDGGSRKVILCTNNENGLCERITHKRLSKVINGYSFAGKKETVLFEKKINMSDLKKMDKILKEVEELIANHKKDYDNLKKEFKEGLLKVIGVKNIEEAVEGIPSNFKYYKTDFVPRYPEENTVTETLMNHIKEMVQLEHGIKLDNKRYLLIMDDEEADEILSHVNVLSNIESLYIASSVLLTKAQLMLIKDSDVNCYVVSDYYFEQELREVGE